MGTIRKRRGLYGLVKVNWKAVSGALLGIAAIFAALFTVSAATVEQGVALPVVMYHSVLKDEAYHGKYVISPQELESDMLYLKSQGYTTILPEELLAYAQGKELPEKPILLTFDDGYYNNYLYAFELAKKHECKFLIAPIGYYSDFYTQTGEKNGYYTHCTWDQLREMADSGLVEVGNHSYNLHKGSGSLVGVKKASGETEEAYRERLTKDLLSAQEAVEKHVGKKPRVFVYPFGAVSKTTPELVQSLGFSMTLTCEEKISSVTRDPNSFYDLGRYLRPSGMSSQDFFTKRMKLGKS